MNDRWFQFKKHSEVEAAVKCDARFQFYRCGRRAYKSELMKRRGILQAAMPGMYGPRRIFFAAPTFKQAKKIFWNDLISLAPKEWVSRINRSDHSIEFIFGSIIEIAGLDQPQRLEGVGYDDGFVDESADVKPSAIAISIMPALADRKGNLTRGGVPKRTGKGARDYNRAVDYALRHGKIAGTEYEAKAFCWTSEGILDENELKVQRSLLDIKDYREQFLATVETIGGGIFHAWGADNILDNHYCPELPIIVGMDFNVSPMCWVLCHDVAGKLYIFDELHEFDTWTAKSLDSLYQRYGHHESGWLFYGDASSRANNTRAPASDYLQILDDKRFKNANVIFPKKNPNRNDRFACTNRMMRDANDTVRLHISPKCVHAIEDVESYSRKENSMEPDDQGGLVGHMSDAIGYVVMSRYPIQVGKPDTAAKVGFF